MESAVLPESPQPAGNSRKTTEERKELLARTVHAQVAGGARIESQSDFQAVVVRGKAINHILHLILSILTLGIWILVWGGLAIWGGEKRAVVSVDEWGNAAVQKV